MNQDQKSLALGMTTGILITFLVLIVGALISQQLSTIELKLETNQSKDVAIGISQLNLVYHPNETKVTVDFMQSGGFPATVGHNHVEHGLNGEIGCVFTVTEVNPDYVVLIIRPSNFITFEYLFRPFITVTDSDVIPRSVLP